MNSEPERTCIGCRGKAGQHELVRLVVADGRIELDPPRHLPGRGAYLHPDRRCLDLALRRGALTRALRTDVTPGDWVEHFPGG